VSADRTQRTLLDLLDLGAMAARLVARGKTAYDVDEALQLAGEAIVHRVGEAVARLPDDFVIAHPSVEWRKIKAMRNLVAHGYLRIDKEILWNALTDKMPELVTYLDHLVDDDQG